MEEYTLYYTLGCHLCEDAEDIIHLLSDVSKIDYCKIDIANDDALLDLYGVRIPVLKHNKSAKELNWPFDKNELLLFVENIFR